MISLALVAPIFAKVDVNAGLIPVYLLLVGPAAKAVLSGLRLPQRLHSEYDERKRAALNRIDDRQVGVLARLLTEAREGIPPSDLLELSAADLTPAMREQLETIDALPSLRNLETLGGQRDRLQRLPSEARRWGILKSIGSGGYIATMTILALPFVFPDLVLSNRTLVSVLVVTVLLGAFALAFFILENLTVNQLTDALDDHA